MHAVIAALLGLAAFQAATALPFFIDDGDKTNQTLVIAIGGWTTKGHQTNDIEIGSLTSNKPIKHGTPAPDNRNGFGSTIFNLTIYVLAGFDGQEIHDNFWSYDVVKNSWKTDLPKVPTPAFGSTAVELGGRIYMLGGVSTFDEQITKVYAFTTHLHKWYTLDTEIPDSAIHPCATVQEKHLYYLSEANLYHSDDGAKTWKNMSSPKVGRDQAACLAIGTDSILLAGGRTDGVTAVNVVEVFNITTNTWKTVAPMKVARRGHQAAAIPGTNNVLVCSGDGVNDEPDSSCEIYDWKKNTWTRTKFSLENARYKFGLFVTQAKI